MISTKSLANYLKSCCTGWVLLLVFSVGHLIDCRSFLALPAGADSVNCDCSILFIIICHGAPTLAPKLCMNSFGMEVFFGSMEIYIINTVCIQIAYSQSRPVMRLGGDFLVFEATHLAIRPLNISCSIELPRAEVDLPRLRSRPRAG